MVLTFASYDNLPYGGITNQGRGGLARERGITQKPCKDLQLPRFVQFYKETFDRKTCIPW